MGSSRSTSCTAAPSAAPPPLAPPEAVLPADARGVRMRRLLHGRACSFKSSSPSASTGSRFVLTLTSAGSCFSVVPIRPWAKRKRERSRICSWFRSGTSCAMADHLLPTCSCARQSAPSSAAVHGERLMRGSKKFFQRSRHCFAVRPVTKVDASGLQTNAHNALGVSQLLVSHAIVSPGHIWVVTLAPEKAPVLLRRPCTLHHSGLEYLGPPLEALRVIAARDTRSDGLPVLTGPRMGTAQLACIGKRLPLAHAARSHTQAGKKPPAQQ